jgi:hypothetical protein
LPERFRGGCAFGGRFELLSPGTGFYFALGIEGKLSSGKRFGRVLHKNDSWTQLQHFM